MEESRHIEMDFHADWVELLKKRLNEVGCRGFSRVLAEQVPMAYFNTINRLVAPQPRTIRKSAGFSCPAHLQAGLQFFEDKVSNGEDLTPHMSTSIKYADFNDLLLNDWGIHHFHLGTKLWKKGSVSRTGPLLYAYITKDTAYFLDVKGHDDFACSHLLKIIHSEWPEVIARHRMNCQGMEYIPTDAEIRQLREAGCSYSMDMGDGTVYFPTGGGYASSGTSDVAVMSALRLKNRLVELEDYVREKVQVMADFAAKTGHPFGDRVCFRLSFVSDDGETFRIVEKGSGVLFQIGD